MSWKIERIGALLSESRIPVLQPNTDRRIRVKLNVAGVEKRPNENEIAGATKQFTRKAGQFIYGRQNFHKGAFGIVPEELDGFETSADIPSFDIRNDCLPEWIYYFFKIGNRFLELEKLARGVGSKRIHPEQIEDIEVPLPSIDEQKTYISKFRKLEMISSGIQSKHYSQLELLKKLRQQILQDAMHGKLVLQNSHDQLAKELLEKIKANKEQLLREKNIKKKKQPSEIINQELPFEIPDNWVWCRLNEICDYIIDCPHSTPQYLETDTGFYGIDTNCINGRGEIIRLRSLSYESYLERVRRLIPQENDIVYAREGSIGLATFIPANKKICLGQRVMLFRPSILVNPSFIKYAVEEESFKNRLLQKYRGMGAKHVNVKDIVDSLIALPPLREQDLIITKIDQLLRLCDDLQLSIQHNQMHAQEILQTALKEMLASK
jgi:type I restriction enzyme, S subunit